MSNPSYLALGLVFALVGCASTYEMSKAAWDYRSSLTEAKALEVVAQNIARTRKQAGVCAATTTTVLATADFPQLVGTDLVFTSYYAKATGMSSSPAGVGMITTTTTYGPTQAGKWKLDLKDLNVIRVVDEVEPWGCPRGSTGKVVVISMSGIGEYATDDKNKMAKAKAINVNVSLENLDRFLAALSFLSPKAKLLHGAGL